MKLSLLVLFALCAFAIALVPRDRRAVNTEEEEEHKDHPQRKEVCDQQTPCAWVVYSPLSRAITLNITNNYCVCASDKACQKYEDDKAAGAFVYRCRDPEPEDKEESDS